MTLPIRTRLTAWYVALLALILAGLGSFLLLRLKADLVAEVDRSLDSRVAQISLGYQTGGEGEFQDVSDSSLVKLPHGEHGAQILSVRGVLESSGDVISQRPMLASPSLADVLSGRQVRFTVPLGPDHELFRLLAVPAPNRPTTEALVVSTSLDEVDGSVHRLLVLFLTAGPAALAAAGLVGWWLARKSLHPVALMTAQASSIGIDRMDERVGVPRIDDELGRLARTLNAMLDRLEQGVEEKRRFVADAAHELRTPLAVMRSELEVTLRSDRLSAHSRDILESTAEEVERMARMVENLLTLARIDEGKLELLLGPTEMAHVASAVVEDLRPLAEGKGVSMGVELGGGHAPVMADRDRLYQAVANLVDNAIKYTAPGGEVRVVAWEAEGEAGVEVRDTGPGIPSELRRVIFDRFVRLDPARSRVDGGSGLGLAICREVMKAHGGRVWVESEPERGSSFFLSLPMEPVETVAAPAPASSLG